MWLRIESNEHDKEPTGSTKGFASWVSAGDSGACELRVCTSVLISVPCLLSHFPTLISGGSTNAPDDGHYLIGQASSSGLVFENLILTAVGYVSVAERGVQIQCGPRKSRPGPSPTPASEGGGGEMLTARLLTDCSITQRNILTPERTSQGHVQTGGGLLFRGPPCMIGTSKLCPAVFIGCVLLRFYSQNLRSVSVWYSSP
jgi:hypothetical protein